MLLSELKKHITNVSDSDIQHELDMIKEFKDFGYEIQDLEQLGYIKEFTAEETRNIIKYISLFEHQGTINFLIRCLGRKGNIVARDWLINFILNTSDYIRVDSVDREENYKWLAYLVLTECIKTKFERQEVLKLIYNNSVSTTRELLIFLAKNEFKNEIVNHIIETLPRCIENNDKASIIGFLEVSTKIVDIRFKPYLEKFATLEDSDISKMSEKLLKKKYK